MSQEGGVSKDGHGPRRAGGEAHGGEITFKRVCLAIGNTRTRAVSFLFG